jgi:hypothetical protein
MDEPAEILCQRIAELRSEVSGEVRDLVLRAKTLADWRYYIRRYPWACLATAFVLGYLIVPARRVRPSKAEIIELLKENQLGITSGADSSRGLFKSAIALAGPPLLRTAMHAVSRKIMEGSQPEASSHSRGPSGGDL